jgi:hypothetical protein
MHEEDYEELVKLGLGPPWKYTQDQVTVRHNGRNLSVARLVKDAQKNEHITFLDGDATNLLRPNLIRGAGPALNRTRDFINPTYKIVTAEIRHIHQ